MHIGEHQYVVKNKKLSHSIIAKALSEHASIPSNKIANNSMNTKVSNENFNWNDVIKIIENFADHKYQYNIKNELQRQYNPSGQNFDAISICKQKCNEKDKFLIHRANNRMQKGTPSYVFKSSSSMTSLATNMNKETTGALSAEYAYFDVKHNRCRDFKTMTLWTFHPVQKS